MHIQVFPVQTELRRHPDMNHLEQHQNLHLYDTLSSLYSEYMFCTIWQKKKRKGLEHGRFSSQQAAAQIVKWPVPRVGPGGSGELLPSQVPESKHYVQNLLPRPINPSNKCPFHSVSYDHSSIYGYFRGLEVRQGHLITRLLQTILTRKSQKASRRGILGSTLGLCAHYQSSPGNTPIVLFNSFIFFFSFFLNF